MKKLSEIEKKSPFKVPDNYFEEVNRKILSATSEVRNEKIKRGFIYRFRTQLAIAASVTGFILLSYTAVKLLSTEKNDKQLSEVLIESDYDSYINDIDLNILEENLSAEGISDKQTGLSKQEIIDYLLLENIEVNDIYSKL